MYFLSILRAFDFLCRTMNEAMLLLLPDIPRFPTGIFFHTDRTRFLPFGFSTITTIAQWLAAIFYYLMEIIVKPVLILVVVVTGSCAFPPAPNTDRISDYKQFAFTYIYGPLPPQRHLCLMVLYCQITVWHPAPSQTA